MGIAVYYPLNNPLEIKMKTPHIHRDVIKAWADGEPIQCYDKDVGWVDINNPKWYENSLYRVKHEWYRDIPNQGILCCVSDEFDPPPRKIVAIITSYRETQNFKFVSSSGCIWQFARPLTKEEMPVIL
jgi:hypothetical protein